MPAWKEINYDFVNDNEKEKKMVRAAFHLHLWAFTIPAMICLFLFILFFMMVAMALGGLKRDDVSLLSDHHTMERFVDNGPVSMLVYFLIALWEISGFVAVILINVVVFKNPARSTVLTVWMIVCDVAFVVGLPVFTAVSALGGAGYYTSSNSSLAWLITLIVICGVAELVAFFVCCSQSSTMLNKACTTFNDSSVEDILSHDNGKPHHVGFEEL